MSKTAITRSGWRGILAVAGLGHLSVALALLVDLSVLLGAEELTITVL